MMLPFAKLGALLMKSLGKPLASRLKSHAARNPRFRHVIINFAQVNLQRRIYGHDTRVVIHPLNPEKAVQAASDILGEFIIFAVAGTIVILEVQRSARSEAQREAQIRAELDALRQRDLCASQELDHLRLRIDELEKTTRQGRASWKPTFGILQNLDESTEIHSQRGLPPPPETAEKPP